MRIGEEVLGATLLDDVSHIHHGDAVGDVFDHREVVRDEKIGEAELVLKVLQQVEGLCLNRDIEGGYRLVRDDEPRTERKRPCDSDALAFAAREGMGIAAQVFGPQS